MCIKFKIGFGFGEFYLCCMIVSTSTHVHYRNRFCFIYFLLLGEMNLGLNPMRNRLSELIEPTLCFIHFGGK